MLYWNGYPQSWSPEGPNGMDRDDDQDQRLLSLTAEIVSSFAGHHTVATGDLPALISSVFRALRTAGQDEPEKAAEAPTPAVPVKRSIRPDFLVCLEDGEKVTMLKRHLAARHGLTPEEYRKRWGLAKDYPMVAPAYAAQRSALAKQIGLGRKRAAEPRAPEAAPPKAKEPRRRAAGRRKVA
jgi:predicted transcriptional regulator